MMRRLVVVFALVSILSPATVQAQEARYEVKVLRDIPYREAAPGETIGNHNRLDLYLPEGAKDCPVVLIVLRGYPGYQCPVCNAQVGQFLARARNFAAAKANVVLVYPGASAGIKEHAGEFIRGKTLPGNFHLVLDPDFKFTIAYGLSF